LASTWATESSELIPHLLPSPSRVHRDSRQSPRRGLKGDHSSQESTGNATPPADTRHLHGRRDAAGGVATALAETRRILDETRHCPVALRQLPRIRDASDGYATPPLETRRLPGRRDSVPRNRDSAGGDATPPRESRQRSWRKNHRPEKSRHRHGRRDSSW